MTGHARDQADDGGSIAYAMLIMMMVLSLTALLSPMALSQIGQTRHVVGRVEALAAAQAGLDVALGRIRAADDDGAGRLDRLPCGERRGTPAPGEAGYRVTIDYLTADPTGHDQDTAWLAHHLIGCGGGPTTTPAFALLRAHGTTPGGTPATRALVATYTFALRTGMNTPGGHIGVYTPGSDDRCLHVDPPSAGTPLTVGACEPDNAAQTFAYTADLTLVLVGAGATPAAPHGMCLDAAGQEPNVAVLLQPCAVPAQTRQQWSFTSKANFAGTNANRTMSASCMFAVQPAADDSPVVLGGTGICGRDMEPGARFAPDAAVGPGAAGPATGQMVNLEQFGRCLDLTEKRPELQYLMSYPCKQTPDGGTSWNQRWQLPTPPAGEHTATGRITASNRGVPPTTYCLRSPEVPTTSSPFHVSVVDCDSAEAVTATTWTVTGDTGRHTDSYTIRDGRGNCLAPRAQDTTTDYWRGDSTLKATKIVVMVCDGGRLQKWNAPPRILAPPLGGLAER